MYAGSMPERMFKISYSSPYASHETGGADTQLRYSCVLAPLATNVDLWKPIAIFKSDATPLLKPY